MKKLRWGVLGTGRIVGKGGTAIQRADNSVWLGVAGRNEENGKRAAEEYGVERSYRSYAELLRDPDIDAVYIALLNHVHKKWAVKAAEAGKHVLLEKPFTLNAEEADEIKEAATKYGVQIMEAHSWRFHPAHLAAREMVREGQIGEIAMFTGHFSFVIPSSSTRLVNEWGGGTLYDIGCYPMSWSRFFMEDEPGAVDSNMVFDPKNGVDMRFAGTLYYPKGRTAQVSSAFDMANGSFYEVLGTSGRMKVDFQVSPSASTIAVTIGEKSKEWKTDRIEPYVYQTEAFADSILNGRPVPYGPDDAVQNMKISDALFAANEKRERVNI